MTKADDLLQCIYLDAVLQKRRNCNESSALTDMVDRSDIEKVLLLADRGYESYNNLAHIQEKGWFFLIRIKDNTNGITSPLAFLCALLPLNRTMPPGS